MKTEITNHFIDLNDIVINDENKALEVYVELKRYEKTLSKVIEAIKEEALNEAMKYEKGDRHAFGIEFEVRNGATRWNFDNCTEVVEMKKKLKERQTQLKSLAKAKLTTIADCETGEIIPLPTSSQNPTVLSIKLPKQ